MQLFVPYIVLMNALGLFLMHQDKQQAKKHRIRIPEVVLFTGAVLGGSLGAILGMIRFHHKTRKPLFSIGLPVLLILQLAVLIFRFA